MIEIKHLDRFKQKNVKAYIYWIQIYYKTIYHFKLQDFAIWYIL